MQLVVCVLHGVQVVRVASYVPVGAVRDMRRRATGYWLLATAKRSSRTSSISSAPRSSRRSTTDYSLRTYRSKVEPDKATYYWLLTTYLPLTACYLIRTYRSKVELDEGGRLVRMRTPTFQACMWIKNVCVYIDIYIHRHIHAGTRSSNCTFTTTCTQSIRVVLMLTRI